ncbi:MAG: formylmethanofuran dehydrogenase subunit C [Acidobacteria bacterium]|nr:formylmethanofuran dehydrogenase subunit C [Acidobacteriota bacterium]
MLTLQYNASTLVPVEVEGLTPTLVRNMSLPDIERFEIFNGNHKLPLAEFFTVTGDPSDARIQFEGELQGVHWIGAQMTEGEVQVRGNAGRHVGSEMTGGTIHVHGNAGDWVGGEMHGGLIHIHGNAGHLIGAAYRGSAKGMTDGTILIDGSAGNEVGHTLRRGLIAIGGSCGDFVGFSMLAGTVLLFGDSGIRPAAGMRRGTVAFLGDKPPALLGTFFRSGVSQPLFLSLYLQQLRQLGFEVPAGCWPANYRMFRGDHVALGRGELLIRETPAAG